MDERAISRRVQAASFAAAFEHFMITPALGDIARHFDTTLAAATVAATTYYLGYGLMQIPWGLLSERIGRTRAAFIGIIFGGMATLAATLAPDLATLAILRFCAGAGMAAVVPSMIAWIGDALDHHARPRVAASLNAAYAVGSALGVLAAGFATDHFGWQAALVIGGLVPLLCAFLLRGLPEVRSGTPMPMRVTLKIALTTPAAVSVAVIALIEGTVLFGIIAYLAPTLLASGARASLTGAIVGVYGVSVLLWAWLFRRVGKKIPIWRSILIGGAMLTAAWGAAAVDPALIGVLLASALSAGAVVFMHAPLQVWATAAAPNARGAAVAMFAGCLFIGGAAGTAAFKPLFERGDVTLMFVIAAAVAAAVSLTAGLIRRAMDRS
ncbi:MAG TPA: MFS transporter [Alphaproteobacteria bacterium]|jgi:predicted MFS family arabinose efflux permease